MIRLRYKNGAAAAVTESFRELRLVELPETARRTGVTLRGRRFDHKLWHHRVWDLAITTDAGTNYLLWLKDWWTADIRYLQYPYDVSDAINWIEVTTDGGRCPITFAEGVTLFPETELTIYEKEPS